MAVYNTHSRANVYNYAVVAFQSDDHHEFCLAWLEMRIVATGSDRSTVYLSVQAH